MGAPRAGLLATTRVGSRHHDRLVQGSTLPEPRDVVSEAGVSIGVMVGYDTGEPLFDDSTSQLVEPPFGDKHGKSLARVERGAGDGLVVYVCLDPRHGQHRLYAWLRQRYSARQQAAIFGRFVDVDLLADG